MTNPEKVLELQRVTLAIRKGEVTLPGEMRTAIVLSLVNGWVPKSLVDSRYKMYSVVETAINAVIKLGDKS